MTNKILAVFTGGTFGSVVSGGVTDVRGDGADALLADACTQVSVQAEFEVLCPLHILSEDLTPAHWKTLVAALAARDLRAYSGIIITHGSDTLPFSAALLSLHLADMALPVVLVAANAPLGSADSNGAANFAAAASFICGTALPGVYVIWRDPDGKMRVHLGARLLECETPVPRFVSYGGVPLGEMREGDFVYTPHPYNPSLDALRARGTRRAVSPLSIGGRFWHIRPFPGLDYRTLTPWEHGVDAVLHSLYHSSTACTKPQENALPHFIESCRAHGVAVYACDTRRWLADGLYSTAKAVADSGAIALSYLSIEAALAKLYLAYGAGNDPQAYMQQERAFEFVRE